jgi:phage gp45-like
MTLTGGKTVILKIAGEKMHLKQISPVPRSHYKCLAAAAHEDTKTRVQYPHVEFVITDQPWSFMITDIDLEA